MDGLVKEVMQVTTEHDDEDTDLRTLVHLPLVAKQSFKKHFSRAMTTCPV